MQGIRHRRASRVVGTGCAAVLVASSMLLAPTTAGAAPADVTVTEIAPDETEYAGWHQGYSDGAYTYGLTAGGLMMAGKSQIINGYQDHDDDLSGADNVNLRRTLRNAAYEVDRGQAWFQVALFFDNVDGDGDAQFTTLRPANPATGRSEIGTNDIWVTSRAISDEYGANASAPLGDLLEEIGPDRKTIAFGVLTTAGTEALVSSIEWDDTTYRFAAAEPDKVAVADSDIDLDEKPYDGWHQGAVNAGVPGEHRVTEQGLELTGRSQVIKGYENNAADVDSRNVHLPSAVETASYQVAEGNVYFQIPLFFTAPGQEGVGFTTLRPADPAQAGQNDLSLDSEWVSSRAIGDVPANTAAPLRELIDSMTQYKVIGFGVYNQSGEATVKRITFDGTTYRFRDDTKTKQDKVFYKDIAPSESGDTYTQWHQGAENDGTWGEYAVTNDGLVLTGRSQVINGDRQANDVSLQHALRDATYNVVDGTAWFQVPVFVDDDDDEDTERKFTTLRPADGAGAGEHAISLQDQWVSSQVLGGVPANTPMPLGDLVNEIGEHDYTVLAFGVFSDTDGSATVSEITWNDTTYEFKNRAPNATKQTVKTVARKAVTVKLPKVDRDGNAVTYEFGDPVNGSIEVDSRKVRYTPNRNFTGRDRFTYTVTDEYDLSDEAKVFVNVVKAKSEITKAVVKPKKLTPAKKARMLVRVESGGDAAKGKVVVRDGRKVLGLRRLDDGKATIRLGRLDRGKHTLKVRYTGSNISKKATETVTVKVRRR